MIVKWYSYKYRNDKLQNSHNSLPILGKRDE